MTGQEMYDIADRIFPICRSITGQGVRDTLAILQEYDSDIEIHEFPTGMQAFDWNVPKEWNIEDAYRSRFFWYFNYRWNHSWK